MKNYHAIIDAERKGKLKNGDYYAVSGGDIIASGEALEDLEEITKERQIDGVCLIFQAGARPVFPMQVRMRDI
jgi:hypothetical protein